MLKITISILFILGFISVTVFLKNRTPQPTVKDAGRKAVASLFFVSISAVTLFYAFSADLCPEKMRGIFLITMGAFFGLVGDILLDLKCVYKEESNFFLMSGFSSFLLGHIAYTASLIFSGNLFSRKIMLLILVGISVIIGAISVNIESILKVKFGKYKPIVAVYSGIIFFAVNVSILNIFTNGFHAENILIYLGLLIILGSDAILNSTYFGEGKNRKIDIVLNHVLYYIGQYLIALSAYFIIK